MVLDLGTGLRALGTYLQSGTRGPVGPLEATVLLTHLHYDHVLGLPFFTPMQDPAAVLDVYGPRQDGGALGDVLAGIVTPPFFPIHMSEFRGELRFHDLVGSEVLALGSATVTVRSVPHVGHTLGFRIEADGVAVVYLSDHQAPVDRRSINENVLELCADADLLIHDAQYTDDEFSRLADWGHSTAAYAVHVATEARARRLMLFHHDPAHTDDEIDRILADARRTAPHLDVSAASEGSSVELGSDPRGRGTAPAPGVAPAPAPDRAGP
jgi:ribonuclease BN (tRNA processing enzyme)